MNTEVNRSGYCETLGNASGRIGDYSPTSAIFVGAYKKPGESFKRVSLYSMIDEAEKWNAPHPKFTASGGGSFDVLHHLHHIFRRHQKDNKNKVLFVDEAGNRLLLYQTRISGDVTVGTEDSVFEPGAVASFEEDHVLYQDLFQLSELINTENLRDPTRNPFGNQAARGRLKLVNLFP
jgi:hypothetical protein